MKIQHIKWMGTPFADLIQSITMTSYESRSDIIYRSRIYWGWRPAVGFFSPRKGLGARWWKSIVLIYCHSSIYLYYAFIIRIYWNRLFYSYARGSFVGDIYDIPKQVRYYFVLLYVARIDTLWKILRIGKTMDMRWATWDRKWQIIWWSNFW